MIVSYSNRFSVWHGPEWEGGCHTTTVRPPRCEVEVAWRDITIKVEWRGVTITCKVGIGELCREPKSQNIGKQYFYRLRKCPINISSNQFHSWNKINHIFAFWKLVGMIPSTLCLKARATKRNANCCTWFADVVLCCNGIAIRFPCFWFSPWRIPLHVFT